ncbi:hypothetical protein NA57DRAFT_72734 [Rhizodiscina lignyota]|uniref:Uncharacterized protein n=1 Tax=Rhizodiscina lignyota TaxID=1504668 RepID=A0A9P4MBD8_9PEZI|nr:hypothetical protein NA57DRAFT_72734 [Rhizodiscina lignyota]
MYFTTLALLSTCLLSSVAFAADSNNCPGVMYAQVDNTATTSGCCVGGHNNPLVISPCPGWPVCTGPTTTSQQSNLLSCATFIPATDDNYSDLVSSASVSLQKSGTNIRTTLGVNNNAKSTPAPTSTGSSGGSASTGSGITQSQSQGSGSSASFVQSQSQSQSTGAAVPVVVELGAIAAGIFGAAVLL